VNKRELQRLTEDEEVMEAVETLRLFGVNGAAYERLIGLSPCSDRPFNDGSSAVGEPQEGEK
jgi:hypothetical protein